MLTIVKNAREIIRLEQRRGNNNRTEVDKNIIAIIMDEEEEEEEKNTTKKTNTISPSLDELFCWNPPSTTATTTTKNNKSSKEVYYPHPYTDIEDQTKVTHGPKLILTTATEQMKLPEPPLSEQIKIIQKREQEQLEQQQEQRQSQISLGKISNIRKEQLEQHHTNSYPDIKKVALSGTSWSEEEFCCRADTFWQKFEELLADAADDVDGDDGTVDQTKLQQALIASNKKFFASAGDVLLMIELMLRTGNIVEVGFHKYIKRTN
jgi:hypothetical protein